VNRIESKLQRIEREFPITIVYACESGSRAWGFASPDSDFDVRFLFRRPSREYLAVTDGMESVELPLDEDLDFAGWDVRKAAALLGKSNGALVEWLHSPIVYRAEPGFLERWRATAREVFSVKPSVDHYRGLAKQMLRVKLVGEEVRPKDYLYALRAILAARWVLDDRGPPPVPFVDLLPVATNEIRSLLPSLLERKATTAESARPERWEVLDTYLHSSLEEIETAVAHRSSPPPDRAILDRLLRRTLRGPGESHSAWTLDRVRQRDTLLFDAIGGSHAYGTALPGSDEDRRGVFLAPKSFLLGLDHIDQVSDDRHDQTYYELGRFFELLLKNNPNALELLGIPDDCVRFRHPLFARISPGMFLSKLCARTYGEYAMGQIQKARGLNKKIVNPQPEERQSLLSFCFVPEGQGSIPVLRWMSERGLSPRECGLTAVRNAADLFAVYYEPGAAYRGLVSPKDPDALLFSSVAQEAQPIAWMAFNENAFRAHCKAHREYWEWVALRNEERFTNNIEHGRGYDSKNLMHTVRLLAMADEIAREGVLRVRRPDREALLKIRAGEFPYEALVDQAEAMLASMRDHFSASSLPDEPDRDQANELLIELREEWDR
jgi:predicted nucleotidyltransferase